MNFPARRSFDKKWFLKGNPFNPVPVVGMANDDALGNQAKRFCRKEFALKRAVPSQLNTAPPSKQPLPIHLTQRVALCCALLVKNENPK